MSDERGADAAPAGRLRPAKRQAILTGSREVFGREGFARASIDAIADAAAVSTRTIYKHFSDKSALFAAVIVDSAERMAETEIALIAGHLSSVTAAEDVEPALRDLALQWLDDSGAWLTGMQDSHAHRTLIAQVHAEAAHLQPETVAAWWHAGPGRVLGELAGTFADWADAGLLQASNPDRAAAQFAQLISVTPGPPGTDLTRGEQREWIADGVAVFVRAYGT